MYEQGYSEIYCKLHTLPQGEGQNSALPLKMREIPDRPFDKIPINLVTEFETSTSGNKHILTMHMDTSHSVYSHVIRIFSRTE